MTYSRSCPKCNKKIIYTKIKNFNNSVDKNKLCQKCASKNGVIIYLTKEKCRELALLCKTRKEFNNKYQGAYQKSLKNNWSDEICKHMTRQGNIYKRCIYIYEFPDNSAYIGLTSNLEKRKIAHKTDIESAVFKYANKINCNIPIIKQLTNYIHKDKASNLERACIKEYTEDGWNVLNRNKGGNLGGSILIWTKEKCLKVALKCKTKKEFISKYPGARLSALNNGWLEECYKHMIKLMEPRGYWTKKRCHEISLKCKSKTEFRKKSIVAYNLSNKNKWMKDICKHMTHVTIQPGYWTKKKCQKEAKKYKKRTHFHKEKEGAYKASRRNGWLDEFFPKLQSND